MIDELLGLLKEHDARMEQYLDAHALLVEVESHEGPAGPGRKLFKSKARQERVGGRVKTTVLEATRGLPVEQAAADKRDRDNPRTESPFAARNQAKYRFDMPAYGKLSFAPYKPTPDTFEGGAVTLEGELTYLKLKPAKVNLLIGGWELVLRYETITPAGRNLSALQLTTKLAEVMMKFSFE